MKTRWQFLCVAALLPALLGGCNTLSKQPSITRAGIDPSDLRPGGSAVITMHIRDRHDLVHRVEGVVLEDPRITFRLRDDGQEPDAEADDGIWSMQVDVPFQAPPGQFVLEFIAYGPDGLPVSVRDERGAVVPLRQAIPIVIQHPQP